MRVNPEYKYYVPTPMFFIVLSFIQNYHTYTLEHVSSSSFPPGVSLKGL